MFAIIGILVVFGAVLGGFLMEKGPLLVLMQPSEFLIIAGAGLKSLYEIYKGMQSGAIARADLILFPVGAIVAGISGFLCIRFLLGYLQKHPVDLFVYYRWAIAALILIVVLVR